MAQQQLSASLDRFDTLLTIASLTLESENHEPGRRELEFFVDSGLEILEQLREAADHE